MVEASLEISSKHHKLLVHPFEAFVFIGVKTHFGEGVSAPVRDAAEVQKFPKRQWKHLENHFAPGKRLGEVIFQIKGTGARQQKLD